MTNNMFRGVLRNGALLAKRMMEECNEDFIANMNKGDLHQYLYNQVDYYLRNNGVKADRKTINVLTDLGKEMYLNGIVEDLFFNRKYIHDFAEKRGNN